MRLTLKGEAGTKLVGGLVKLLGVERATQAQGNTLAEEDVVGQSGHAAVVDLDLGKGDGVDAVLAGNLKADSVAGLGVPGGLGTGLNLAVNLVVVRGGEDAQVVGGGDGSAVDGGSVADGGAVGGDGGLADVVAGAGTGEEALVADNGVDVGDGTLEQVKEGTAVEAGLLEVQVELGTLGGGGGEEVEETLKLEALGEGVVDLELSVEGVGGVPSLGQGEASRLVVVFSLNSSRGGLLVAGLAGHLEGDAIGGSVLELKGGGREVVEILVEELDGGQQRMRKSRVVMAAEAAQEARHKLRENLVRSKGGRASRTSLAGLAMSEKAGTDILASCEGGMELEAEEG
jgi:hypothetical protein